MPFCVATVVTEETQIQPIPEAAPSNGKRLTGCKDCIALQPEPFWISVRLDFPFFVDDACGIVSTINCRVWRGVADAKSIYLALDPIRKSIHESRNYDHGHLPNLSWDFHLNQTLDISWLDFSEAP